MGLLRQRQQICRAWMSLRIHFIKVVKNIYNFQPKAKLKLNPQVKLTGGAVVKLNKITTIDFVCMYWFGKYVFSVFLLIIVTLHDLRGVAMEKDAKNVRHILFYISKKSKESKYQGIWAEYTKNDAQKERPC